MSVGNMHIKELLVEAKQLTRIGSEVYYLAKTIAKPQGVSLYRLLDQAILLGFGLLIGPVAPVESGKIKPGSNNGCPYKKHISEAPTAALIAAVGASSFLFFLKHFQNLAMAGLFQDLNVSNSTSLNKPKHPVTSRAGRARA